MEPMTVDRIKKEVAWALGMKQAAEYLDYKEAALLATTLLEWAYTWAHQRAARLELQHRINHHEGERCDSDEPRDWLAYVLDEIGWKE